MSLQSSMAVMKAKLSGNLPALQALALQGDFEAVAALKEMMDKKSYAQSAANETAMSQEDTLPVMQQLVGQLQTPQSGLAAYAEGGWAGSGYHANQPMYDKKVLPEPPENGRSGLGMLGDGWDRLMSLLRYTPNYSNEGRNYPAAEPPAYPEPTAVREAEGKSKNATLARIQSRGAKPTYSGIAAAAAPASEKRGMAAHTDGMSPDTPDLPPAEDQTDDELRAHLATMEPLQKKRDALREMSRKQLEDAYNARVKLLTPSKYDQVMSFLAGVQEKGGRSAAQALGAGAQSMHKQDKAAQEKLAVAKEAYMQADLLEQQAVVRDQMGDAEGAYKLRQQAAALKRQLDQQKSTDRLQRAQESLAYSQADYYRGAKTAEAEARAAKARGSGLGAAAGKPMTEAQRIAAIQKEAAARAAADGKDLRLLTPADRDTYLRQGAAAVDALRGKGTTPATASSSGFKVLGIE